VTSSSTAGLVVATPIADSKLVGTRDGKRTRQQYEDLTQQDADAHISDVQYSATSLKKFNDPLLLTLTSVFLDDAG
jgi:hypothetical protein